MKDARTPEVVEYRKLEKEMNSLYNKARKHIPQGGSLQDGIRAAGLEPEWNRIGDRMSELSVAYGNWKMRKNGIDGAMELL